MNKTYTPKAAAAVCNRLLKSAKQHKEMTRYTWKDAAGNQCFCDGFRAYRLRAPLENMPKLPGSTKPFNLDPVFKPLETGNVIEAPAPDPAAVKTFLDDHKVQIGRGRRYDLTPFDMGAEFPSVNAVYLLDVLQLFPGASWYVLTDPVARLYNPVFIVHEAGTALIMPVRDTAKLEAAKKAKRRADNAAKAGAKSADDQKPAETWKAKAEPVPAPKWNTEPKYFIYARMSGDDKYYLANLAEGTYKVKAVYAPMYPESRLEEIKEKLDACAAEDLNASFQIRRTDGKRVVYTAIPTFTPELFAEHCEPAAMTPEQFAAAYAA